MQKIVKGIYQIPNDPIFDYSEQAKDFIRKKYSYQTTGKNYKIELDTIQPYKPREKKK